MAARTFLNPFFRAERSALRNAIGRCHNPKHQSFYNYGARGIEVHPDWRGEDGFDKFILHVGPKGARNLTLDRIDNDLGYEPGNVRWSDRSTQQHNRRRRKEQQFRASELVSHNGKTQTWKQWANELGLQLAALRQRVARGLPLDEALSPRLRASKKTIAVDDKDVGLIEWCQRNGQDYTTVSHRLKSGDTPAAILYGKQKKRKVCGKRYELNGEHLTIREWAERLGCDKALLHYHLAQGKTMAETIASMRYFKNRTIH